MNKNMERREKVNALRELAVNSGRNISMDPDRWGEHMLDSLEVSLGKFLQQIPGELKDELEDAYIGKYTSREDKCCRACCL